jgi:hypothetical protein
MPLFELEGFGLLDRAPLYDRVFEVERYQRKFAAYLDLLTRHWFNYENIYQQASFYHEMIAPYVIQSTGDMAYFGETAWFDYTNFEEGWMWLAEFARDRSQFILNNLNEIP